MKSNILKRKIFELEEKFKLMSALVEETLKNIRSIEAEIEISYYLNLPYEMEKIQHNNNRYKELINKADKQLQDVALIRKTEVNKLINLILRSRDLDG